MRIGLIIYGSLETVTGGFLYDRILVEHLRSQGDEVEVISLPWRSYGRTLGDNLSRPLSQRLRQAPLDILLQDELNHPSLFRLNRRLRRLVRYPIVTIVHLLRCGEPRPAWRNRLYRWVESRYLGSVDGFVFNSESTRASVEGMVAERRPSIVACPAGDRFRSNTISLTAQHVRARATTPGPLRVLFVGNIIARKQLHVLIAALARLPREDWRLEIVGSDSFELGYARNVRRQITEAQLDGQIDAPGVLLDEALADRLARSHLLAVPSTYEGFGMVYLEGMGFGLPAIASTGGAAREIIEHESNGFLVAPGDMDTLAQYLAELSRDRTKLARMSVAALNRYAAHPTWEETASRIRQFLCTMVS